MTPTLRQWMLDMTGPEDAFARTQYAAIVTATQSAARWIEETATNDDEGAAETLGILRAALSGRGRGAVRDSRRVQVHAGARPMTADTMTREQQKVRRLVDDIVDEIVAMEREDSPKERRRSLQLLRLARDLLEDLIRSVERGVRS